MSTVGARAQLFKLAWVTDPAGALTQGRAVGISDPHFIEMSAWCAELHAQLAALAVERDLPLLLMGGNAAALRLEASKQRGSRDNDYLTTASADDIRALMDAFVARFAEAFEPPLFRYRQLTGPPDAEPLPMLAFAVDVPALIDPNARDGRLGIKLEFHIEDAELFPEGEAVSGRFFALAQDMTARIPKLPYQIALKLMTLHAPPVGIDAAREDAIPRQLYDIDLLLAKLQTAEQWSRLADYSRRRYVKEERQRSREPTRDGPWPSIVERLDQWALADDPAQRYGQLIGVFQASQVAPGTRRPPEQWRARARRLRVAARCLGDDRDSGYQSWARALDIETRISEPAGTKLREYRAALSTVTGVPARRLGQFPRVAYWEHIARAERIDDALDAALRRAGGASSASPPSPGRR